MRETGSLRAYFWNVSKFKRDPCLFDPKRQVVSISTPASGKTSFVVFAQDSRAGHYRFERVQTRCVSIFYRSELTLQVKNARGPVRNDSRLGRLLIFFSKNRRVGSQPVVKSGMAGWGTGSFDLLYAFVIYTRMAAYGYTYESECDIHAYNALVIAASSSV